MQVKSVALAVISAVSLTSAVPQGVTSAIAPSGTAPAGCQPTYAGTFNIATVNATTAQKRDLEERQTSGTLTLTLDGGVLKDMAGRTGYIASNYQFQFDGPPQAGAIYTSGFSVCSNGSLALGGDAVFYACQSGGFYNLYNKNWAPQCDPIYIQAVAAGDNSGQASTAPDGQPTAGSALPSVTEQSEGQPAATSVASSAASEQSDGQPIATTVGTIVTEASDGQPVAATSAPAPSAPAPITTSIPVISQQSDGQPIASSAAVSGPASATPLASERPDGQPIGTGASNGTATPTRGGASSTTSLAVQSSAGASNIIYNMGGLAMGVVGAMAFL
ncbi:MAG: hypothetical protein M1820_006771 [Bogoriella megaspora]|nr:MAG: hypothetical protein M1820_006771 [Bogoriella megaspora]